MRVTLGRYSSRSVEPTKNCHRRPNQYRQRQERFLDTAIASLAEDGKVVCVRLALLAEMMKTRLWTEREFRQLGGVEGLGITFLDETFTAKTASPACRRHEKAARHVLQALLPNSTSTLKGPQKSQSALLEASGYSHRPDEFRSLLKTLDHETRLITAAATESDGSDESEDGISKPTDDTYYQLTHGLLGKHPCGDGYCKGSEKQCAGGRNCVWQTARLSGWQNPNVAGYRPFGNSATFGGLPMRVIGTTRNVR